MTTKDFTNKWGIEPVRQEMLEDLNSVLQSYQKRINGFMIKCFTKDVIENVPERSLRFIEEAIELVQATGLNKEHITKIMDYVYSRPIGERFQEVGGVMVTLAALCTTLKLDIVQCSELEYDRIMKNIDNIRAKQEFKRQQGIVSL